MATISKVEAKWLISALNTHIETCKELMENPAVGRLTCAILNHQAEGYRALRNKLERALTTGAKQILIK